MFSEVVAEVAGLGDAALCERFVALEAQLRRSEAELAVVVAEVERRGRYGVDGHRTVRGWLRAMGGWSGAQTVVRCRLARLVTALPACGEALHDGRLGVAQAVELANAAANPRCGDQLADVADVLVHQAAVLPFEDFRTCVRRWEALADSDGAHRSAEAAHERRRASVIELDGTLHVTATGGPVDAAVMGEIFARFCDAEFATDVAAARARYGDDAPISALARTDAQRRFDALRAIFDAAATAPIEGRTPEPVVNIVVDQVTFENHLARRGLIPMPDDLPDLSVLQRRCETSSGVALDPDTVLAAALHGWVRRVVLDSTGTVTDMGRRRRLFTGAAREAVRLQAGRCIWPGCTIPAGRCQIDHTDSWTAQRGPTRPDNGAPMCGHHNRWKERGYRTRRDDEGIWHVHRPDGSEIGRRAA
jgi:hypothetical protein